MQTSAELSEQPIRSGRTRRRTIIEFRFPIPAVRRLQLPANSGHRPDLHIADIQSLVYADVLWRRFLRL